MVNEGKNISSIQTLLWIIVSAVIILFSSLLLIYSPDLTIWAQPTVSEIATFTLLEIFAGICFVAAVFFGSAQFGQKRIIWAIIITGIIARLILLPSVPILEDDYNRYIWDGAVLSNGINPYKYSPLEIDRNLDSENSEISTLKDISIKAKEIFSRINYPEVRTIYPMGSQIFFAASYLLSGWNITGWRIISFIFDIFTLALILKILKRLNLPLGLISIYWINPIVLHQFFNAGHMDILVFPFILFSIFLVLNNKHKLSTIFLSIAVGIKVWPILLFPVLYRKYIRHKKKLAAIIVIASFTISVLYLPVLLSKLSNSLGFIKYAGNWYNNDAVFRFITICIEYLISLFSTREFCFHCIARFVVAGIYLIIFFIINRNESKNNLELLEKSLLVLAALFFLSPTVFPWYYTWMLPFLVFRPKFSLILYTVVLPLYQFQYIWPSVVWFEHIPIIILFGYEMIYKNSFTFMGDTLDQKI